MKIDKWYSIGDVNAECGGLYVKHTAYGDDYVEAVECIAESEVGGRDNVFLINDGTIYLSDSFDTRKSALSCVGYETYGPYPLLELVYAMFAYGGIERDIEELIQIGKHETVDGYGQCFGEHVTHKPANLNLMKYIESEYLL